MATTATAAKKAAPKPELHHASASDAESISMFGIPGFAAAVPAAAPGSRADKPRQIQEAARLLFMRDGFARTSMDAVSREAGVSKATLYAHFGSKEELFASVIHSGCMVMSAGLEMAEFNPDNLRQSLIQIGRTVISYLLSPYAMSMYRLIVADLGRVPELGRLFYQAGPNVMLERGANYFASIHEQGLLDIPEPRLAIELFTGMIRSDLYHRKLLGVSERIADQDIQHVVETAVDVFMKGFAPAKR